MWFCVCVLLLLSSCSLSFRPERSVEVVIGSSHPWEEASHAPMPYRLVTSQGEEIHLSQGVRSAIVSAPRGETMLVAAYPLESQYPFTGVVSPQDDQVVLTQDQSRLIIGLFSVWSERGASLRHLCWPEVEEIVAPYADTLQVAGTIAAILNGSLSKKRVPQSGLTSYRIEALPEGRWYSERQGQGSFWHDAKGSVTVTLAEGLTSYYCLERNVVLRLFVQDGKVVQHLQALFRWF